MTKLQERLREQPPLTCPHIDRFLSVANAPQELKDELEAIKNINSQLRYGLFHERARADAAEAEIARLKDFIITQKLTELLDRHVAGSRLLAQPPAVGEDVVTSLANTDIFSLAAKIYKLNPDRDPMLNRERYFSELTAERRQKFVERAKDFLALTPHFALLRTKDAG